VPHRGRGRRGEACLALVWGGLAALLPIACGQSAHPIFDLLHDPQTACQQLNSPRLYAPEGWYLAPIAADQTGQPVGVSENLRNAATTRNAAAYRIYPGSKLRGSSDLVLVSSAVVPRIRGAGPHDVDGTLIQTAPQDQTVPSASRSNECYLLVDQVRAHV
jgi:hypothetical protein